VSAWRCWRASSCCLTKAIPWGASHLRWELLVEQYLSFAELRARRGKPMRMADWPALLERWWAAHGDRPVGVSEIDALLAGSELLAAALGEGSDRARKTRLGMLLAARHGRIYGQWRIVRAPRKQNAAQYRLVPGEGEGP